MESNDDRVLSHYLWSLDNALSGLIELCNNGKPDSANRIIQQVEDKLNVWNKHVVNTSKEIASNTVDIAWGDCPDEEEDNNNNNNNNEDVKESPVCRTTEESPKAIEAAWGDCSDEEDNDLDCFILSDATGLCKAATNGDNETQNNNNNNNDDEMKQEKEESAAIIIIEEEDTVVMDDREEIKTNDIINNEDEQPQPQPQQDEAEAEEEEIKKQEATMVNEEEDETMAEIENIILCGPLFIDDTQQKVELTWAQRTKQKQLNNTAAAYTPPHIEKKNHKKKQKANKKKKKASLLLNIAAATKERSQSPIVTTPTTKKRNKQMRKKASPQAQPQEDGWSKVYRSKKNKIQRRNSGKVTHGNKSQQQRLFEAESKKKAQILQRQQKHAEILSNMSQKLVEKEKKEKKCILQKKRASKERLKKAEDKRKKTDLLRKEKAIKDDVRREEIRIFQEWQQHEKKSAIVEKQVAAEIRKLKMAQKLTQKLSNTEQRVKNIQRKQKNKYHLKQRSHHNKTTTTTKQRSNNKTQQQPSTKHVQKKPPSKAKHVQNNNVNKKEILTRMKKEKKEEIFLLNNCENEYFDAMVIARGLKTYLAQPALHLSTTMARDELHHFYAKTNKLIHNNKKENLNCKLLEEALSKLLRGTVDINFADIHFDNDALLAIHRLTQFEVGGDSPFKCTKLLIHCLVLYSVNGRGCRLLCCKYVRPLLQFLKECVTQYVFKRNDAFQSVLAQCCVILSRIFNEMVMKMSDASDVDQFTRHCVYKYLFELFNGEIFSLIAAVFKSITISREYLSSSILDGFISVLIAAVSVLPYINENEMYFLMKQQLDSTKCGGILNLMSKLVFYENPLGRERERECDGDDNESVRLSRESVTLLNGCIAYLNCICKMNSMLEMLQSHILEYEMEIYHIFIILLQFTCSNFMKNSKRRKNVNKINEIRELCKGLLEFITFCARNNERIQDMFRFISCNKPTLIKQLTQFPFFFFINHEGKLSLYPTLIAITQSNQENLEILKQTLNTKLIKIWLKQNIFQYVQQNNEKKNHKNIFKQKVPMQIWSKCLKIY